MVEVCLSIGSNLGDRIVNLSKAINILATGKILSNIKTSKIYESKAVLLSGSPKEWNKDYYNMVIKGNTDLLPNKLLEQINKIEKDMGRTSLGRWSPRVIDIDILTYGDEQYIMENLKIPHPLMLNREWIMIPLTSLNPKWRYPVRGDYYMMPIQDITQDIFKKGIVNCHLTDLKILELENV